MRKISFIVVIFVLGFFVAAHVAHAGMSSTNYKILTDALEVGGYTTSSNYGLVGGAGEWQGVVTSSNYNVNAGFPAILADPSLSISVANGALSFGTLEKNVVASKSTTVTVTTDAPGGYSLRISENKNFTSGADDINDVSDGLVSDGSEEYGIRTSGTAGLYNSSDTSISTSWKNIASASSAVTSQATTVSFKVSVDNNTTPGSYSHTVTFAAVTNF